MKNLNTILLNADLSIDTSTTDASGQKYTTEQPIQAFSQYHNVIRLYVPFSDDYVVYGVFQANNDAENVGDPAQFIMFNRVEETETISGQVYNVYEQTVPSAVLSNTRATRLEFVASLWSKEPYVDPQTSEEYIFRGLIYVDAGEDVATQISAEFDAPSTNDYVRVIENGEESDWYYNGSAWVDNDGVFDVHINEFRTEQTEYAIRKGKTTNLPTHAPTNTQYIIDSLNSKLATSESISLFYQKSESDYRYINADGDTVRGDIDMGGHKIINVDSLEAINVTIGDLNIQENLDAKVSRDGSLPITGTIDFDSNSITNLQNVNGTSINTVIQNAIGLINGTKRAKKAENVDDNQGNATTAQQIKQTVDRVNQSVTDTSTPEFSGVNLGTNTLTDAKLDNYDDAYAHSQITDGTNPHETIASEIDVNTNLYTDPDLHLDAQANNIQTALDQLYNHAHDSEYVKLTQLGVDVAELGQDGKVLANQLHSYIDDIVTVNTFADLPTTGDKGKIYVVTNDSDASKNTSYRWSDTGFFVFDQTTAEWGSISGTVTDQTDIENAKFTSTVSNGSITGDTIKEGLNQLDNKVKQVIQGNQNIDYSDADLTATNVAGAISEVQDNVDAVNTRVDDVVNGSTQISFTDADLDSNNLSSAISEVKDEVDDVVSGNTDITYGSTTVASELSSLDSRLTTAETDIDNVENGTTDIAFDNTQSGLKATNVKDAIDEIDSRVDTAETDIDNIESGATQIDFDNTGTGLDSTKLDTAIKEIYAEKGANNGIATLDSNGKLPSNQLTVSALEFKSTFGSTGALPTSNVKTGDFYICDIDNFTDTTSGLTFNNGDKAIFAIDTWYKNDANDAVTSVNGEVGAITLDSSEISADVANFDKYLSSNDDTIQKALDTLDDHTHTESDITDLDKYDTNTIDGFLANKSDVGHTHTESDITDLDKYSQSEVDSLLANKVDVGTLSSSLTLYPTTTYESGGDFDGYAQMVISTSDSRYNNTPAILYTTDDRTETGDSVITSDDPQNPNIVGQLIADAGLFTGDISGINTTTIGEIQHASGNRTAFLRYKIFNSSNMTTPIAVSEYVSDEENETFFETFQNAIIQSATFDVDERIVIHYEAYKESGFQDPVVAIRFGGQNPTRTLLPIPVSATQDAQLIAYDNTNSTLSAENVQSAVNELDDKILDSLTTIRVEQFSIINADNGDGTFTYQDANNQNQTGTFDGTFYTFDLQVAGYYVNNNLVTVSINDDTTYHTTDTDNLLEGTPDAESVATSVKVAHAFTSGDSIDVRYYQGVSIVAQSIGDGTVTFGKLDSVLQSDINEVRDATSSQIANRIVKRNSSNEFSGILNGKLKTARTIQLSGDVAGQADFDGSQGINISTIVADDSHNHTNLAGAGLTYNTTNDRYDVDKADNAQALAGVNDARFMTPLKTKSYVDNAVIDGGEF